MCNTFDINCQMNILGDVKKNLPASVILNDCRIGKGNFVTIPAGTPCVSHEDYDIRKLTTTWVSPVVTVIDETCSGVIIDDKTTVYYNEILVLTADDRILGIPIESLIFEKKCDKV